MASLSTFDYAVFVMFLAISLAIGAYHALTGGRQRTTSEFIMADRQLSIVPTVLSMVMSFTSAIMIVGLTAEMYRYGIQYMLWSALGSPIGLLVTAYVIVPWLYELKLTSINEVTDQSPLKLTSSNEVTDQSPLKLASSNEETDQSPLKLTSINEETDQSPLKLTSINEETDQSPLKLTSINEATDQSPLKLAIDHKASNPLRFGFVSVN